MATLAIEENQGPLAPWMGAQAASFPQQFFALALPARADDDDGERRKDGRKETLRKDAHELLANLTLALIIAHVAGGTAASYVHRGDLARAMVTGMKRR